MKKVFAIAIIAVAFVACNNSGKSKETTEDTVKTDTTTVVTPPADTTTAPADTTVKADTTK